MRSLLATIVLVGSLIGHSTATGRAGAAERIFAFAAYELETLVGEPFTIAPDCGRSQNPPVTRCSFGQFLNYIWAPGPNQRDPDDRPVKDALVSKEESTYVDKQGKIQKIPEVRYDVLYDNVDGRGLSTLVGVLSRPQKLNDQTTRTTQVNDWVDVGRLCPSANGDYATAVDQMSERSAALWRLFDSENRFPKDRAGQLYTRATKALTAALEIRRVERDNHKTKPKVNSPNDPDSGRNRVYWLKQKIGAQSIVLKAAPNTSNLVGKEVVLDGEATRAAMSDSQKQAFDNALKSWVENPFNDYV